MTSASGECGGNCHKGALRCKEKAALPSLWAKDNKPMMSASGNHSKKRKSGSRSERLAAALRENLHRRKAQERARVTPASPGLGIGAGQTRKDDSPR
jgi:hypothetical protein